ncbi:RNase HII [Knoellia remsis]|uniref:Ribonuclease HII n=1 Tax=Knoellia remsis TaxID=407159 RepID=A0A2T0UZE9_9MICO|nr:ribonuclease HII [Knoellia remsis]PRY63286.1 RNase HII [Knoellia remsis]
MPPAVRQRKPSLRVERALQRDGYRLLAGMDEVGRGALAGPVTVGVVVIDETCRSAPQGVRDSKLLQPHVREAMVPRIRRWAHAHAVGHASPAEIDEIGIIAALRLAGRRALAQLAVVPDLVILDGNHDWLTEPDEVGLLAFAGDGGGADGGAGGAAGSGGGGGGAGPHSPPVTTMIKADLKCSSVASASVLAKVERDRIMVDLAGEHTAYGWELNKGYAAPEHLGALREHGPSELHRRSWRLPGTVPDDVMGDDVGSGTVDAVRVEPVAAEAPAPTLTTSEPTYDEGHQ